MGKTMTPVIGLAVVVALALAAVFGSMSLANPAMAAIGQPADAELTERTDSPQSAPQNVKAVIQGTAGSVDLTWDDFDPANTYQVRQRPSDGDELSWSVFADATEADSAEIAGTGNDVIRITGLEVGKSFDFEVREGSGARSQTISVMVTGAPSPPTARSPVVISGEVRSIKIGWGVGAPVINGAITKWQYQAGPTGALGDWKDMGVGNPNLNEYTIPNLNSDTAYLVNIRAVSVYTASTALAFTDATTPKPAKPTGLEPTSGDGMVSLKWDVTDDPGVYGYEYRYKEGEGAYREFQPVMHGLTLMDSSDAETARVEARKAAAVVNVDVPNLENGTEHTFQVRALSTDTITAGTPGFTVAETDRERSDWSDAVMMTPVEPTAATLDGDGIPDPETFAVGEAKRIDLSDYFTDGAGSGDIDSYDVSVAPEGRIAITGLVNGNTESGVITLIGLADGVSVVTVTARDGEGPETDDPMDTFTVTVGTEAADVPAPNAPSLRTSDQTAYDAADNAGSVTIHWADPFDDRITRWQYAYQPSSPGDAADNWMTIFSGAARSATISGLMVGTEYTVKVRGLAGSVEGAYAMVTVTPTKAAAPTKFVPNKPTIELSSSNPGKNARYTVRFNANNSYVPGVNDLIIQLTDEDFQVPSTIPTSTVTIQAGAAKVANPADISVDDQEITLVLGDMDGDTDGVQGINPGENVTVVFRTAAGISNPTEGGDYEEMTVDGQTLNMVTIKRTIGLSEDEGGRGDAITVTGKGFKNGTTVTFVRMMGEGMTAADFASATSLCSATAGGDDIASCEFTVTSPLFKGGMNYINAVDGRSNMGSESEPFTLEPSITANPKGGSPGDSILVQLYDFGPNAGVESVLIARRTLCAPNAGGAIKVMNPCGKEYSAWTPTGSTSHMGEMTFRVVIPNDAPLGVQDLQVKTSGGNKNTTITIAGPLVTSTPSTVIANQRVSLVGNGFTSGAKISQITFAGDAIDSSRIASGSDVSIDGGGNWNASVDLPLNTSTVAAGTHALQVKDSAGRIGQVSVVVPERSVTITPDSGRVGTIAVVRGEHFPSKNDEGDSFNVVIVYGAANNRSTTVSTVPDASGRFEVQLRIPTTAAIPSTNDVSVSFGDTDDGGPFTMNVTHEVPEGAISLSQTSGGPGTMVTINGEGFKAFVPVTSVTIGSVDISPAPRPHTDGNGMLEFDVLIPGLDTGIQTIEVRVGQTTASKGFTVTESGVHSGDIRPVAAALEPLGDNIVSAWHFNNDTKVWSFYDPTLAEGNTLTHTITGETYLIRVKTSAEVILNRDTRSLTCVGDNCWNQVVW